VVFGPRITSSPALEQSVPVCRVLLSAWPVTATQPSSAAGGIRATPARPGSGREAEMYGVPSQSWSVRALPVARNRARLWHCRRMARPPSSAARSITAGPERPGSFPRRHCLAGAQSSRRVDVAGGALFRRGAAGVAQSNESVFAVDGPFSAGGAHRGDAHRILPPRKARIDL